MWLCTMAAPPSMQAIATSAISAGSTGTFGLSRFDFTPLIATSMITGRSTSLASLVTTGS